MSLDACEVLSLASTEELLRVLDRGYVGNSDSTDGLARVVSCPRLRPRSELPLLYASDGSLHRGRATTAAFGHARTQHGDGGSGRQTASRDSFSEDVPRRRSFAQRAVLAGASTPMNDSGPTRPEPTPKVASKGFGGIGRRRWSVVSDNKDSKISAFNKLASRKKQQEAESMIKQMAQEALAKRKELFASLTKQMEADSVDVPQAIRRSHLLAPRLSPLAPLAAPSRTLVSRSPLESCVCSCPTVRGGAATARMLHHTARRGRPPGGSPTRRAHRTSPRNQGAGGDQNTRAPKKWTACGGESDGMRWTGRKEGVRAEARKVARLCAAVPRHAVHQLGPHLRTARLADSLPSIT